MTGDVWKAASDDRVSDMLSAERIALGLKSVDKDAVLAELVALAANSLGPEAERDAMLAAVLERESVLSTGIGDGVALPHAKYDRLERPIMAAGVSRIPISFGSLDGKPVRLFFLLLSPESAGGEHVRALSRISRLLRLQGLRARLTSSERPDQFLRAIEQAEGTS